MDRIDTDVVTIQDAEASGNDFAVSPDRSTDGILWVARYIEGTTARWIGFVIFLRSNRAGDPDIRNLIGKCYV